MAPGQQTPLVTPVAPVRHVMHAHDAMRLLVHTYVGRSQKFAVPKMPLGRCGPW